MVCALFANGNTDLENWKEMNYRIVEAEIEYFKKYKNLLNDFISADNMQIKLFEYMSIVEEIKDVETHIKTLTNDWFSKKILNKKKQ